MQTRWSASTWAAVVPGRRSTMARTCSAGMTPLGGVEEGAVGDAEARTLGAVQMACSPVW
ncbi:hypothetical protein ACIBHY_49720 [Nonomuraea sp. NPDC050547]|uniref:hypothetical protein n=1 Tax=Nonomuraea sp. NPDC050547 TaxID=3364368 RepID=UPI00379EF2C0